MRAETLDPRRWIGTKVAGRYLVVEELSRGGMGAVFVAVQEPLDRNVALKVMLPGPAAEEGSRRRFIQEAQALSRIPHPNIVTIFDFGETDDGSLFIAMELVEGRNLRDLLHRDGRVPWHDTVPLVIGVARALASAHASGILHRDLKPENIMLAGGRRNTEDVKLLDFGLARTLDSADNLTQVNAIPGTPSYIAPERIVSRVEDPRSDLYSLGAIWFELLTGRQPFGGETMAAILLAHIQEQLPSLEEVAPGLAVPSEIDQALRRLLAKRPEERWSSVEEFLEEIVVVGEALLGQEAFGRDSSRGKSSPGLLGRSSALNASPLRRETPSSASTTARGSSRTPSASRWTTFGSEPSKEAHRSSPSSTEGSTSSPSQSSPPASSTSTAMKVRFRSTAISFSGPGTDDGPEPAAPSLPGKTALIPVGKDSITVQTEWSGSKRAFVSAAFFRGRTLRQSEVPLPEGVPADEAQKRMDAAHGWFVDGIRELLAERSPAPTAKPDKPWSQMFFFAVEAYAAGDRETALRTLESVLSALPDDERVKNSHMKLLLEMDRAPR